MTRRLGGKPLPFSACDIVSDILFCCLLFLTSYTVLDLSDSKIERKERVLQHGYEKAEPGPDHPQLSHHAHTRLSAVSPRGPARAGSCSSSVSSPLRIRDYPPCGTGTRTSFQLASTEMLRLPSSLYIILRKMIVPCCDIELG